MTTIHTYTRQDGTVVPEHQDKRWKKPWWSNHPLLAKVMPKLHQQHPDAAAKLAPPQPIVHPQTDDSGNDVVVKAPSRATTPETWTDPMAVATFTPGGATPGSLNGVEFGPWLDVPTDEDEWEEVEGTKPDLDEPMWDPAKEPAAGVVIEEPDGRIWVVHPTNSFGGYRATFPKGHQEVGMSLQASAIKEAYEEAGLQVEITGFLGDVDRTTTTCRYYRARRVGGTPRDMGWESQAVSLVPRAQLYSVLNMPTDHPMAERLGAGEPPAKGHK